jgi:hypothetical protein
MNASAKLHVKTGRLFHVKDAQSGLHQRLHLRLHQRLHQRLQLCS